MNLKLLNNLTLLYIEDDDSLREKYSQSLEILFLDVYQAFDYNSALKIYYNKKPDILLVDINIGKLSGFDLVKKIRSDNLDIPIIFLTAFNSVEHLLKAVNLDVNGYIVKPLDINKLQKSMQVCLRKINKTQIVQISENLLYTINNNELVLNNKVISLGKKENLLLRMLIKNKKNPISREDLEYEIWGYSNVSDSAIKNLISSLRRKIGKDKIVNVSGIGWRMNI